MKALALLLGSIGVLAGLAIHAEAGDQQPPQPGEFAKICDLSGPGYQNVPLTYTCNKVSGYVRMDVIASGRSYAPESGAPAVKITNLRQLFDH
jgi:hypothetical protein